MRTLPPSRSGATLLALVFSLAAACSSGDSSGGHAGSTGGAGGDGGSGGSGGGGSGGGGSGGAGATGGSGGVGGVGGGGATGGSSGAGGSAGTGGATPPDAGARDAGAMADAGGGGASDGGGDPGAGVTAGMTKIFDGTTLMGWEGNPMLWSVKDGTLDGNGKTGGEILMTKDDYADFRLIVSSRMVANQSGTGHLGICFWGGHMPVGKYNGCKLLIPPGGGSWDYGGGGGLPGITHPMTGKFNSSEWHQSEVLCKQATGSCRMATDGIEVVDYKEPNPGRLKKGPIGVQIHSGTSEVQYKDVWVDSAPTDDKLRTVK